MTPVDAAAHDADAGRRTSVYPAAKRVLDLVLATVAIVVTLPVMAVAALAVLATGRPVLFRQTRIGRDGQDFTLLKFRTMYTGISDGIHREYVTRLLTEDAPPRQKGMHKLSDDRRITPVGAVLRRSSIDELPQLFNVLRGHMSLVGPRPALPYEVDMYDQHHLQRLTVKPGITGLWQISGRSQLTMREALDLDVDYVHACNMALDLRIIARTIPVVLSMRGAR